MQSFNWVDIDGIRYSWDGEGNITCAGQFGYQASIAGDRLDGMEIENDAGEVAGAIYVDFASASITYTPAIDAEESHGVILIGDDLGQQEYSLASLSSPQLQDLLGYSEPIPWSVAMEESVPTEVHSQPQGHILSWDSFHFDDEVLVAQVSNTPVSAGVEQESAPVVTISLDLTNQVLDQIPPLHDI
ncbi:hypothetical protein [Aeromonas sp. MdU4]|uniref:hypothetical protein n=1 Tax=Aeromonas sp. MdU4 TaxID=3342819 RepID=UPI0035B72BF7